MDNNQNVVMAMGVLGALALVAFFAFGGGGPDVTRSMAHNLSWDGGRASVVEGKLSIAFTGVPSDIQIILRQEGKPDMDIADKLASEPGGLRLVHQLAPGRWHLEIIAQGGATQAAEMSFDVP